MNSQLSQYPSLDPFNESDAADLRFIDCNLLSHAPIRHKEYILAFNDQIYKLTLKNELDIKYSSDDQAIVKGKTSLSKVPEAEAQLYLHPTFKQMKQINAQYDKIRSSGDKRCNWHAKELGRIITEFSELNTYLEHSPTTNTTNTVTWEGYLISDDLEYLDDLRRIENYDLEYFDGLRRIVNDHLDITYDTTISLDGVKIPVEVLKFQQVLDDLNASGIALTPCSAREVVSHKLTSKQFIDLWHELRSNYKLCEQESVLTNNQDNQNKLTLIRHAMNKILNYATPGERSYMKIFASKSRDFISPQAFYLHQHPIAGLDIRQSNLPYDNSIPEYDIAGEPLATKFHFDESGKMIIDEVQCDIYKPEDEYYYTHDHYKDEKDTLDRIDATDNPIIGHIDIDLLHDTIAYHFYDHEVIHCTGAQARGEEDYIGHENDWKQQQSEQSHNLDQVR